MPSSIYNHDARGSLRCIWNCQSWSIVILWRVTIKINRAAIASEDMDVQTSIVGLLLVLDFQHVHFMRVFGIPIKLSARLWEPFIYFNNCKLLGRGQKPKRGVLYPTKAPAYETQCQQTSKPFTSSVPPAALSGITALHCGNWSPCRVAAVGREPWAAWCIVLIVGLLLVNNDYLFVRNGYFLATEGCQ